MNLRRLTMRKFRTGLLPSAALWALLGVLPAHGADMDADAEKVLRSMSSYLGGTEAFTVTADIDFEIVAANGQKLQLSSFASAALKRPSRLYVERKGMVSDAEVIYDGKTLTIHGRNLNVYAQSDVAGAIDDAILAYEAGTGIPAPGADLLFADPYAVLSSGVESSLYVGMAYVQGVECHHLAFREGEVDWQLWVRTGDAPLPMKYVITTKWHTGAPQYEIRFRDWNTNPKIDDGIFSFTVPPGAEKLAVLPVDEMGDFTSAEEAKK